MFSRQEFCKQDIPNSTSPISHSQLMNEINNLVFPETVISTVNSYLYKNYNNDQTAIIIYIDIIRILRKYCKAYTKKYNIYTVMQRLFNIYEQNGWVITPSKDYKYYVFQSKKT